MLAYKAIAWCHALEVSGEINPDLLECGSRRFGPERYRRLHTRGVAVRRLRSGTGSRRNAAFFLFSAAIILRIGQATLRGERLSKPEIPGLQSSAVIEPLYIEAEAAKMDRDQASGIYRTARETAGIKHSGGWQDPVTDEATSSLQEMTVKRKEAGGSARRLGRGPGRAHRRNRIGRPIWHVVWTEGGRTRLRSNRWRSRRTLTVLRPVVLDRGKNLSIRADRRAPVTG